MDEVGDDARRTAALAAYDVLLKPPRRELVAVVDLAARICGVPMATINLITDTEQHQAAAVGFDASICSREDSMCAAILGEDAPVVVPDASQDPRFRDNPFVTGSLGDVRFYAAHKLVTPDGVTIGTLCVFDDRVRHLDEDQRVALGTLAERIVDILELELVGRALQRTLAELELSNERLTSFAGQVSHDLKTPLASLSLSLEVMRDQLEEHGSIRVEDGLLDRAIDGSSRMARLIDQVLDYARLGGSLKTEAVDLGVVVGQVLQDLDGVLAGVEVRVGPLPVVVGDPVLLRSVLQNLLDNAAKYRHPDRAPTISVSSARVDDCWRVEVVDNGRGVPAEARGSIFDPLTRADRSVEGSGIGLSTCRRILSAHGGTLGCDPVPGGGSTFWFALPA
ncbi:ATP-binding protein [Nocardioides sp. SYSU D00038]|uniref:sensor histidine kinase n=1 Tax=Nocardioides sp. SYSU D00038 TaxID=2812554 RepID=UPI0019679CCE|nr:GAF domain-containing sensor histidine kinase [Nocardioides sp. SYSU D00038]